MSSKDKPESFFNPNLLNDVFQAMTPKPPQPPDPFQPPSQDPVKRQPTFVELVGLTPAEAAYLCMSSTEWTPEEQMLLESVVQGAPYDAMALDDVLREHLARTGMPPTPPVEEEEEEYEEEHE
jgi:hypothetical protein